MLLEIVTHCWNYSSLLRWHIDSLFRRPATSDLSVLLAVFYSTDDDKTIAVLNEAVKQRVAADKTYLVPCALATPDLCRRAIGRNVAAVGTRADWLWFTDCDYLLGECLPSLPQALEAAGNPALAYPATVEVTSQQDGDRLIQRAACQDDLVVDCPWEQRFMNRAIGGIQIVRGDIARRGYLPGHPKWQRPAERWMRTHEDVAYRQSLGTEGTAINLPGVRRIRHSLRGREVRGLRL